jgi:hypothetical protein
VLDLTHVLAGPFCTYQLGLLGADVIKIEDPSNPDCARGRGPDDALNAAGLGLNYQVQGGNKRSLAMNLRSAEGAALLSRSLKPRISSSRIIPPAHWRRLVWAMMFWHQSTRGLSIALSRGTATAGRRLNTVPMTMSFKPPAAPSANAAVSNRLCPLSIMPRDMPPPLP